MSDILVINLSSKYPEISLGKLLIEPEPVPDDMKRLYVRMLDKEDTENIFQYSLRAITEFFKRKKVTDLDIVRPILVHEKEIVISPPGVFSRWKTVYWIMPRGDAQWSIPDFAGNKMFYHIQNKEDQIKEYQRLIKIQQAMSERSKQLLHKVINANDDTELAKQIAQHLREIDGARTSAQTQT